MIRTERTHARRVWIACVGANKTHAEEGEKKLTLGVQRAGFHPWAHKPWPKQRGWQERYVAKNITMVKICLFELHVFACIVAVTVSKKFIVQSMRQNRKYPPNMRSLSYPSLWWVWRIMTQSCNTYCTSWRSRKLLGSRNAPFLVALLFHVHQNWANSCSVNALLLAYTGIYLHIPEQRTDWEGPFIAKRIASFKFIAPHVLKGEKCPK